MTTELLIYCYGAVCLSMIFFNFLSIFAFKGRESREQKQGVSFKERIDKQLLLMEQGEALGEKEFDYLTKKLCNVGHLVAFGRALDAYAEMKPEAVHAYLTEIHSVFLYLSSAYLKKEGSQSAYFLSFINKYRISCGAAFDALTEEIMEYFKKPTIYCALNAMDTLIISGQAENVVKGLRILRRKDTYFYTKVISRMLCSFEGDKKRLALELWEAFGAFPVNFQTAFVDYFSAADECGSFVLSLLCDEQQDSEVRYSAIRYFGKHPTEAAYPKLCEFASDRDVSDWVYSSQAATALASYPHKNTVKILKSALSSPNYYVRFNATVSLDKLGVTYNELGDILGGNDRYAKEMITYQAEHKSLKERQAMHI